MPTVTDILRVFRDHVRFTGDGQPNAPVGAPLPRGDPRSGMYNFDKFEIRELLIAILQTQGDAGALQEILTQLNAKADLAFSGRIFGTRQQAVDAGQAALPVALGKIWTIEGTFANPTIVIRTPGATAGMDPLFPTAPFWNVQIVLDPLSYTNNSGLLFRSRPEIVAAGQASIPPNVRALITLEGTALVFRSWTHSDDDPIFPTTPYFGAIARFDVTAEAAAREAAIAPVRNSYRDVRTVAGITPKIIDDGAVILWEEGGRLYGPGLGGGGSGGADMDAVRAYAEPRQSPRGSNLPIITGGRDLWLYRSVMGQLVNGSASVKPRIMMTGDSWVGMNLLATALRERIARDHLIAGAGSWAAIAGARFGPGGYSRLGSWQEMDITQTASAVPVPMPHGMGLDGHLLTTTGTDATCVFTNVQASEFTIYSLNQGGTWGYVLNGAPRVVVNDSNDGALKITRLSMNPAGGNTLTIDTIGNTGRVSICSYGLTMPGPGVEIWQAGNGGSMGVHWSLIAPNIRAIAADIQPHVCVVVLGTNDYRYVSGTSSYIQGLRDIRDAYRLAVPDIGFLFVAPARSAGIPLVTPQVQLRDALYEFCISERHEFYNMYDDWPDYPTANARGMWEDTAHPTLAGYRAPAARIYNQFFKV